ncbi:MAG TPA: S8 family serine peptidase [Gemmatimonadaceae bacterium]|nr:S8 family serine peptidase [Gemmatimonadaceae bacterium]
MKPHLEVKLRRGVPTPDAPYWEDAIHDKAGTDTVVDREVARLLARQAVPVLTTRAYAPESHSWSPEEIAAGLDRVYRLVLLENRTLPQQLLNDIQLIPTIEYARLGAVGRTQLPQPEVAAMSVTTDRRSREAIFLEEAQQYSLGDPSVVIAVLDTGVWTQHPEFKGRMLPGRDFVDILDGADQFLGDYLDADEDPTDAVGHGTHVTGILVARGQGMPLGVAPKCRILPVRVLGALRQGEKRVGAGLVDNINVAIKWAIDQGATIINMSLGVRHTGGGLPHKDVIDYAKRKGVTVVAAAGNDGQEQLYYPGALPHVIAVGAVDERGDVAPYSTYGKQVSFVAPGTNIYSAYLDNEYAHSTGTSHATPFVTGGIALLRAYAKAKHGIRLSDARIKHVLKHSADRIDGQFKHPKAGYGHINLLDAMKLLEHKLTTRMDKAA